MLEAFAHPRQIDTNLVDAQQTRRIVDRLVGYTLSPLLSRKVRGGLSAGRVQSVAVRIVVDREREIGRFLAREYWTIEVALRTADDVAFTADLVRIDGEAAEIAEGESAETHAAALRTAQPVVDKTGTRPVTRSPAAPFTTSTLQQEASRKLGFSPKRTMSVAQRLYEGVETADGQVGLITYMRTDSTAIAGVAMGEARDVIGERYGPRYTMPKGRVYRTKSKGAQEAHESIRPTSFRRDPESLAKYLKSDEARLYRLIWQRAIASQMAAKEMETTTIELTAGRYGLRSTATRTVFDGFSRVYTEGRDDEAEEGEEERTAPVLAAGDVTSVDEVRPTQHFTEPPPRYTEATLIKALEEHGIGRPSTYAATISTITDRGYVKVVEKRLRPEIVAEIVTDLLVEHFGEFVDLEFTARMEERLDEVASGERAWVPLLREFYGPLKELVDEKRRELKRKDFTTEATDEVCSAGSPDGHPARAQRPVPGLLPLSGAQGIAATPRRGAAGHRRRPAMPCPECNTTDGGVLVTRRGRFGPFAGCSRYPDCKYIQKTGPQPPDPAAVRRHVPAVRGGPPGDPPRPPHGQPVLGLLALPDLRLHDVARAGRVPSTTRMRGRSPSPLTGWPSACAAGPR